MFTNKLTFIQENLYVLKQEYGQQVDIYRETFTVDFKTGRKIPTRTKITVLNGIVLPVIEGSRDRAIFERAFLRTDIARVGSSIDIADRVIIIDSNDLPYGYQIMTNDYVIVGNTNRYDIKEAVEYEYEAGWTLKVKETKSARLSQTRDMYLKSRISLVDQVSIVP